MYQVQTLKHYKQFSICNVKEMRLNVLLEQVERLGLPSYHW